MSDKIINLAGDEPIKWHTGPNPLWPPPNARQMPRDWKIDVIELVNADVPDAYVIDQMCKDYPEVSADDVTAGIGFAKAWMEAWGVSNG